MIPEKLLREDRTLYSLHTRPVEKLTRWNPHGECNQFSFSVSPDYGGGITEQEALELAKEIEERYNSFNDLKDHCNRLESALQLILTTQAYKKYIKGGSIDKTVQEALK